MTGPTPSRMGRTIILSAMLAFTCLGSCRTLKSKSGLSAKDHISATVNGRPIHYAYNVTGVYDTSQNLIILQAFDTAAPDARMFAITFTLGPNRLDTLSVPQLFSATTDAFNRQTRYAQIAWDSSSPDGLLLDNFTYREKSDLKIWLDRRKEDVLQGRFQGLLYNYKQRAMVKDGSFRVRIVRR